VGRCQKRRCHPLVPTYARMPRSYPSAVNWTHGDEESHMALFLILLLILAAAAGVLGVVVKVALGVALGIFAGFVFIAWFIAWRFRRVLRGAGRDPRWRRVRGSRVEVLDRPRDD
jgi:Flp pilus assembly protein TadB